MKSIGSGSQRFPPDILAAAAVILLQVLACGYFIVDALADETDPATSDGAAAIEIIVALALLAGIVLGSAFIMHLVREARMRDASVAIARGALSQILAARFSEWGLSRAEADVALFSLKGCTVGEIAEMRNAAPGTVRAQLSQVYSKAGVSSQPMLMSLFLEDLMSESLLPPAA